MICLQVEQALFKSLLASDTRRSVTRAVQDNSSSSRSFGPTDSIFSSARVSYQDARYRPIAGKLLTNIKVLNGLGTSKLAILNIKSKIALSMQSTTGLYLHAGCRKNGEFSDFRVSLLDELWLAVIC